MKEFNKSIEIVSYTIGEVHEKDLNEKIYGKMIEDFGDTFKVKDNDYVAESLDMFASDSYVRENLVPYIHYTSMDEQGAYPRNNQNIAVDIQCDPNNIPIKERRFDIIFTVGNKFGYGINHNSLFEIERIIKLGGLLVVSLSKYWFYKEFSQMLLGYRSWQYLRALEVNYKIIETKVASAKYFCYFKFKG